MPLTRIASSLRELFRLAKKAHFAELCDVGDNKVMLTVRDVTDDSCADSASAFSCSDQAEQQEVLTYLSESKPLAVLFTYTLGSTQPSLVLTRYGSPELADSSFSKLSRSRQQRWRPYTPKTRT